MPFPIPSLLIPRFIGQMGPEIFKHVFDTGKAYNLGGFMVLRRYTANDNGHGIRVTKPVITLS